MRQDGMRDLTMQMQKSDEAIIPLQLRQVVVTAVTGNTVTINLDGTEITGVHKIGAYTPAVNDTAWLFQNGADLLVLGTAGASSDSGWLVPTFENSWVEYPGTHAARYRKLNGIVYIRGLIQNGTFNNAAFTLPVGFRPINEHVTNQMSNTNGYCRVDALASGAIVPYAQGSGYSNAWVSVAMSFIADG